MPFDAIFFDAGNTLVFVDPSRVVPLLVELGADPSERAFREAELTARLGLARTVELGSNGTEGRIWAAYFENIFRGCGVPEANLAAAGDRVRRLHAESHLWTYVDPETGPALERLKASGHRLAVISNADGRMEGVLRATGLKPHFEFVMDSAVEGVEKPDAEIFRRACTRMGIDPGSGLYVGDLYPVDIMGAQGAGLAAVLLDPTGSLDFPVDRIPNVAALPGYVTDLERRLSRQP